MSNTANAPSPPRFASILAARSNHDRPSDLEVHLRAHCHKLSVHEKLSGAHLVFPGEASLAVRAYYPIDLQALDKQYNAASHSKTHHSKVPSNNANEAAAAAAALDKKKDLKLVHEPIQADDLDGLQSFVSHFQLSMVLFVLPPEICQEQLDNLQSFPNRAMRLLEETTYKKYNTRIVIVANTQQAIQAIVAVAESMTAAKSKLKQAYFERHSQKLQNTTAIVQETTTAVREWADRMGLLTGEADVLMRILGSLQAMASADPETLQTIPCERRTKEILQAFFHKQTLDGGTTSAMGALEQSDVVLDDMIVPEQEPAYYPDSYEPAPRPTHPAAFAAAPPPSARFSQGGYATTGPPLPHSAPYEQPAPDRSSYAATVPPGPSYNTSPMAPTAMNNNGYGHTEMTLGYNHDNMSSNYDNMAAAAAAPTSYAATTTTTATRHRRPMTYATAAAANGPHGGGSGSGGRVVGPAPPSATTRRYMTQQGRGQPLLRRYM